MGEIESNPLLAHSAKVLGIFMHSPRALALEVRKLLKECCQGCSSDRAQQNQDKDLPAISLRVTELSQEITLVFGVIWPSARAGTAGGAGRTGGGGAGTAGAGGVGSAGRACSTGTGRAGSAGRTTNSIDPITSRLNAVASVDNISATASNDFVAAGVACVIVSVPRAAIVQALVLVGMIQVAAFKDGISEGFLVGSASSERLTMYGVAIKMKGRKSKYVYGIWIV